MEPPAPPESTAPSPPVSDCSLDRVETSQSGGDCGTGGTLYIIMVAPYHLTPHRDQHHELTTTTSTTSGHHRLGPPGHSGGWLSAAVQR